MSAYPPGVDRWQPDALMIEAVLSTPKSSHRLTDMGDADRCWLVAGLTLAGMTGQDIADRMHCSLRLIRAIRAEPMTAVCMLAQRQAQALGDEVRRERCQHLATRGRLAEQQAEVSRLRSQVDRLLASMRRYARTS